MIKTAEYTPDVYYKQSRDFQLFGRLFDIPLNATKSYADMIYTLDNMDYAGSVLIELLAYTLGFKQKHNYDIDQLKAVCSILPSILKVKGTRKAVELVGYALINAEGSNSLLQLSKHVWWEASPLYANTWVLVLPELKSLTLLHDLLNYIWPAGLSLVIASGGTIIEHKVTTFAASVVNKFKLEILDNGQLDSTNRLAKQGETYDADYTKAGLQMTSVNNSFNLSGYTRPQPQNSTTTEPSDTAESSGQEES